MMLIRPPVVREMRQNLWVKMTAKPDRPRTQPGAPSQDEQSETDMRLTQLKTLGELRAAGVLTDDEFDKEKARILT